MDAEQILLVSGSFMTALYEPLCTADVDLIHCTASSVLAAGTRCVVHVQACRGLLMCDSRRQNIALTSADPVSMDYSAIDAGAMAHSVPSRHGQ